MKGARALRALGVTGLVITATLGFLTAGTMVQDLRGLAAARTSVPSPDEIPEARFDPSASDGLWAVDVYEDGSGVVFHDGLEVAAVEEGTFPWDCTDNGNSQCGPDAPEEVRGFSCVQFVVGPAATTLHYCTDGDLDTWQATDTDTEGEVIG